jgi:hypothetical protein
MVNNNSLGKANISLESAGSGNLTNGDSSLHARGTLSSEGTNRTNAPVKRLTHVGSSHLSGRGSSVYSRSSKWATSVPNASTAASCEFSGSGLLPMVSAGGVPGECWGGMQRARVKLK